MSAKQTYAVVCDRCGHAALAAPEFPRRLFQVRADLAQDGWTHHLEPREIRAGAAPSLDLCPACSAAAPEEDKAA